MTFYETMEVNDFQKYMKHLNCSICEKRMRIPKRLPCKHDICYGCLKDHIVRTVPMTGYDILEYLGKSVPDIKPVNQSFICPIPDCNTNISPRNASKPTYEWAAQMENNTLLLSVSELCSGKVACRTMPCDGCCNLSMKSHIKSVCFTCLQKMCLKCEYIHKQLNSGHVVCDLPKSHKTQARPVMHEVNHSDVFSAQSEYPSTCKVHDPHCITKICLTCSEECCAICCESRHSQCKEKTELNETTTTTKTRNIIDRTKLRLEMCRERCLTTSAEFVVMLQEITQKKMAFGTVDEGGENETVNGEKQESTENILHILSCYVSRFEYLRDNIQACLSKLSVADSMEVLNSLDASLLLRYQDTCEEIEREISDNSRMAGDMKKKVQAHINIIVKNSEKTTDNIQNMRTVFEGLIHGESFKKPADESENVQMLNKLSVKCDGDTKTCWITDSQFLNDNCIVIADNDNKKLKLVSLDGRIQEEQLESGPWGIATNKANLIGVTLPDLYSLQVYKTSAADNSYLLKQVRKQTFQSKCYGIAFLDQLIATTLQDKNNERVAILNEDGTTLKEIPLGAISSKYIRFITNNDLCRLILSDFRCNKVEMFDLGHCDLDSDLSVDLQSYVRAGYVTGIDADDDQIFCCNNSTGTVCRIGPDSEEREMTVVLDPKQGVAKSLLHGEDTERETILVKGLSMPRSLAYNKSSRTLAVTVDSGPLQNYMCIYQIN